MKPWAVGGTCNLIEGACSSGHDGPFRSRAAKWDRRWPLQRIQVNFKALSATQYSLLIGREATHWRRIKSSPGLTLWKGDDTVLWETRPRNLSALNFGSLFGMSNLMSPTVSKIGCQRHCWILFWIESNQLTLGEPKEPVWLRSCSDIDQVKAL